jgi:hypothetical protein
MVEQPVFQTDYSWAVIMLSSAATVLVVLLFRALWRRNGGAAVAVAVAVAFGVAAFSVVLMKIRMATGEQNRRAEAQARLDALGQSLHARAVREQEARLRLDTEQQNDRLPDDSAGRQLSPAAVTPVEVSAAWLPEVDEQFEADVYPSTKLASQALVREWLRHFDKLQAKGVDKPKLIRMVCDSRTPDIDTLVLLEAMDELVQKKFPETGTLVITGAEARKKVEPQAGEIEIRLTVSQSVLRSLRRSSSSESGRSAEISGILLAGFKAPTWSLSFSTRFIEKPWLTATSEFLSLRHGTTYLVVRCSQLASSGEEATRDVLGRAANWLGHLIDPRENQGLPRASSAMMLEQLEAGNFIADRFVQKLKRPYGDVYREAVLLDVGSSNLQDMIQLAMSEASAHQAATERRSATQISGVVGLLVVVGALTGLYLLLNWLTKGYYRGPLTVALCVAGSGAIVGAIMLIGILA